MRNDPNDKILNLENEIAYRMNILEVNRAKGRATKKSTRNILGNHLREYRRLTGRAYERK